MTDTTDTPQSDESIAESLLEPIETDEETEADEAPEEWTDSDDEESEDDASEVDDDKDDEDESEDDDSDDDEEETDDDEKQPEPLYTVKVDGEDKQVTLQEALRGYSGQAYIQKGMEAVKAQERQLQEQAQSLQQQSQIALQLYQQAQQTGFTPAPQEPDPALASTDPIAYLEADAAYKTQLRQYQSEQQQAQYLHQQQQMHNEAQQRQAMMQAEEQLLEDMPELRDPKKAEEFKGTLLKAKDAYGYSQDELREIVKDLRSVKALADAQKWRDLQEGRKAAKKPREQARSVTRPTSKARGSGKAKREREMHKRAMKTQSDADWAQLLLE